MKENAILVYDGECPFCSQYVRFVRIKEALGTIELYNAREGGALVDDIKEQGYDIDEGMVLILGENYYHGADCIHMLSLMSSNIGLFNRLNAMVFSNKCVSKFLYPILRAGRNLVLLGLRRKKINM